MLGAHSAGEISRPQPCPAKTKGHADPGSEAGVRALSRGGHYVLGFLWYSPLRFAKPRLLAMGDDPNDRAGLEEMRKGGREVVWGSVPGQSGRRICFGEDCGGHDRDSRRLRDEGGLRHVAGLRGHGAVDRHAFRTEAPKLFLINTGYQLACYPVMGAILAGSGRY